jgi:hypothetical protein
MFLFRSHQRVLDTVCDAKLHGCGHVFGPTRAVFGPTTGAYFRSHHQCEFSVPSSMTTAGNPPTAFQLATTTTTTTTTCIILAVFGLSFQSLVGCDASSSNGSESEGCGEGYEVRSQTEGLAKAKEATIEKRQWRCYGVARTCRKPPIAGNGGHG